MRVEGVLIIVSRGPVRPLIFSRAALASRASEAVHLRRLVDGIEKAHRVQIGPCSGPMTRNGGTRASTAPSASAAATAMKACRQTAAIFLNRSPHRWLTIRPRRRRSRDV